VVSQSRKTFLIARKNSQKSYKMAITSVVCDISHAEFGFEIGFQLSAHSSVTPRTKRTKGLYHGNKFWARNAIHTVTVM